MLEELLVQEQQDKVLQVVAVVVVVTHQVLVAVAELEQLVAIVQEELAAQVALV
jgi:hypothetical protein